MKELIMEGVREYDEEFDVILCQKNGRLVIRAYNEGGCSSTAVDLMDVMEWVAAHKGQIEKINAGIEAD